MEFQPDIKKKYIDQGGFCPYCQDDYIRLYKTIVEDHVLYETMECLSCQRKWVDIYVYRLHDIVEINEGNPFSE